MNRCSDCEHLHRDGVNKGEAPGGSLHTLPAGTDGHDLRGRQ